jgi:iron complex outermembrane receptor protein
MSDTNELRGRGPAAGRLRALLLSTAIVSAAALPAGGAWAQAASTAAAATADTGLGEVVVTARKRDENLQNVPVTATVVSAPLLQQQNLQNFYDLRGSIPDLYVSPSQGGSGINLSLRGTGATSSALIQSDARIGLYLDGMFVARPEGNSLYFYDQSNLQVLYGPQGTLFGRNTSGGAVLVDTVRPSANGTSYVQATVGNFDTINTEGGINVPITDTLFTRFSFRTENSAGYITHLLDSGTSDNINDKSFRGQVRWQPTSQFTADVLYEHDESRTNGSAQATYKGGCTAAGYQEYGFNQVWDPAGSSGTPFCSLYQPLPNKYEVYGGALFQGPTSTVKTPFYTGGDYTPAGTTPFYRGGTFDGVHDNTFNMRLSYDLTSDITIKSTTTNRQSREQDFSTTIDTPQIPYDQYNDQGTAATSEELNLTGKAWGNRLHYVVGFYYYDQVSHSLQFDGTDYCDPAGWNDVEVDKEKSYAGYGQIDFDVTSKLQLEVGGRYTDDWKYALGNVTAANEASSLPGCGTYVQQFVGGVGQCANTLQATNQTTWTNFNPEGAITYKITPDINLYGTVRSAYDQGGFNAHALSTKLSNAPPYGALNGKLGEFQPDHFTDYEVGLKTEWFEHTLRVDVNGYYEKYEDLVTTVNLTINGISTRNSQNAGNAHYEGFEGALEWQPIRDFDLGINGSFFSAAYDSILPAAITSTFTLKSPIVGVASPAYTYSIRGSYTLHPYKESRLTVALNYKAQAAMLSCQVGANYICTIPAYGLLGGKATFQLSPDSPWTIGAFVTNLLDSYWLINRNIINPVSPGTGYNYDVPGAPREFGMVVKRTF